MKTAMRTHTCGELRKENVGKEITLSGWVSTHRIQGKISFIILKDKYGEIQVFISDKLTKQLGEIRRESVVQITGEVGARPPKQVKKDLPTGEIEIQAKTIKVISAADPLPLEIDEHIESSEEVRLKYRYLDLRRPQMQKNLLLRHK